MHTYCCCLDGRVKSASLFASFLHYCCIVVVVVVVVVAVVDDDVTFVFIAQILYVAVLRS